MHTPNLIDLGLNGLNDKTETNHFGKRDCGARRHYAKTRLDIFQLDRWDRRIQPIKNIMRSEVGKEGADTLVMNLKPATLEEFRAAYSETDSLAGMAMGALYNEDQLRVDQTSDPEGGIVSIYEIYQEQQMTFGVAVLMSELRRDLADKLAMRFVDRNVKKGATYQYFIVPTEYDETGHIILDAGVTEEVKNEKYKPEPFDVAM